MKRFIYSAAALALALLAGSCAKENLPAPTNGTVTYTINVPVGLGTKAIGDDVSAVTELHYEVYRTAGEKVTEFSDADNLLYHKTATLENGTATISIEFVNDQNFTVLFWAQVPNNGVYTVNDLTNVTVAQSTEANTEKTAAFAGRDFVISCVSEKNGNVTLTRPIAQLNIGTTMPCFIDKVTVNKSSVKVNGLSTSYNIATEQAGEASEADYVYTETTVPSGTFTISDVDYTYVAKNYLGFIPGGQTNIAVSYGINTSEGNINNSISNVPVKTNYRTNIFGNLLTASSEYTITLDANWGGDDIEAEVWDGKTITAPSTNADGAYLIKKPSEFAWLSNQLFAEDAEIEILADLDMQGTSFLSTQNNKALTVNGNGHTISNFVIVKGDNTNGDAAGVGMFYPRFPYYPLTINDLTIDGATAKNPSLKDNGHYAAVISSYTEGDITLNNVHVTNSEVSGMEGVGGLIGMVTQGTTVTVNGCSVSNTYISNLAVEKESGYVAALVGKVAAATVNFTGANSIENVVIDAVYAAAPERGAETISWIANKRVENAVINGTETVTVTGGSIKKYSLENSYIYVSNTTELTSAIAKANASSEEVMIVLGDGNYSGCFNTKKDVTIKAANAGKAVIDGMIAAESECTVTLNGLVLTNANKQTHPNGNAGTVTACLVPYQADFNVDNCTFNLVNEYAMFNKSSDLNNYCTFTNCVFNCNGKRPLQSKTNITIDNCTFNDQYRYSIQLIGQGNVDTRTKVVFTNNKIVDACKTSGEPFVCGVSISANQPFVNVDFTISGNTEVVYTYDAGNQNAPTHLSAENFATCDFGGVDFIPEDAAATGYMKNGNVYEIYNASGLRNAFENTEDNTASNGVYTCSAKLMRDIDLAGGAWTPIAYPKDYIGGDFVNMTLDGNGKSISNLNISGTECTGLFTMYYGTVSNLTLNNISIEGTVFAGAIAGKFCGSINSCNVNGLKIRGAEKVGGFVGLSLSTKVSSCVLSDIDLSASTKDCGGLVGCAGGDATAESYTDNTISGKVTAAENAGALCGKTYVQYTETGNNTSAVTVL